jgi:SPP1 family predicted phage head-tail adaptor
MDIQRLTTVSNGFGGYVETWNTVITDYDGVMDQLSGNEKLSADQISPNSTHILIGPIDDINENDRVAFNGKIYDVKNIDNPMNMNKHLEILLEYKGDV